MTINSEPNPLDPPDSIDQIHSIPEIEAAATGSCWWSHKWSKWEDHKSGTMTIDGRAIGSFIYQQRRCLRCNKVELQKITT